MVKTKKPERICKSDGCVIRLTDKYYDMIFCAIHYIRITTGTGWFNKKPRGNGCSIENCNKQYHGKGYCRKHYESMVLPLLENGKIGIERRREKSRFRNNISRRIGSSLQGRKRYRKWESLVGYTLAELKVHLESLFTEGMSWDTYGVFGWHVDHVYPQSRFSFANAEDTQFKKCWALSNLQPLWWHDNVAKSDNVALV